MEDAFAAARFKRFSKTACPACPYSQDLAWIADALQISVRASCDPEALQKVSRVGAENPPCEGIYGRGQLVAHLRFSFTTTSGHWNLVKASPAPVRILLSQQTGVCAGTLAEQCHGWECGPEAAWLRFIA